MNMIDWDEDCAADSLMPVLLKVLRYISLIRSAYFSVSWFLYQQEMGIILVQHNLKGGMLFKKKS